MDAADVVSWSSNEAAYTPKEKSNNFNMPPSKVIHCRAVAKHCIEIDLVQVMKLFGSIKAVKLMPQVCQALVEFEELESAIACVTYSHVEPILLLDRQMFVNYSKSTEIKRTFSTSRDGQTPSKVLLWTLVNVIHPVTVDTIRCICEQQNVEVQRISMFHKNGLQAFVEFKSIDEADQILQTINGCDIYPGCCTLKIDYAKTTKLNVHRNTEELYNIDIDEGPVDSYCNNNNPDFSILLANAEGFPTVKGIIERATVGIGLSDTNQYTLSFCNDGGGGEGHVVMVFGLNNDRMNCNRLFNLFCLYGHVSKVKILVNKPGCAMVQYTDRLSTEMAIQNLNNLMIFGQQFKTTVSKHSCIVESHEISQLSDGTPSDISYHESRNNRFKFVAGGRNDLFSRIHPPSKVLHYFNAPPDTTEERLNQLFGSLCAEVPLKQAAILKPNGKSSSGLLEFSSLSAAAEALILVNHATLYKDDVKMEEKLGGPFTFKLAFSTSRSINK